MSRPFLLLSFGVMLSCQSGSMSRVEAPKSEDAVALGALGRSEPVKVGELAPNFQLSTREGSLIRLSDFRGQYVLVNFWHTRCPPCIYELPSMEELNHRLRTKPFNLLAVSVDPSWDLIDDFLARIGVSFSFAILLDSQSQVATGMYALDKYPETFLVDPEGLVLKHYVGGKDWVSEENFQELLALIKSDE